MDYKNTEFNELALPISIEIDPDKKEEIIGAIKESDLKCIIGTADEKTKVTISVNDLEKLEQLLQPFRPIEDNPISIPRPEKKEKLLPILNGIDKMYDRSIERLTNRINKSQEKIKKLNASLNSIEHSIRTYMARNAMLAGVANSFPIFSTPVNALIRRNEKKITRMQTKFPKLERKLQVRQNNLDKLNKKADHLETRKSVCVNLSSVISSFAIMNKTERSEQYIGSMIKLNNNLQKLNTEKINTLNTKIADLGSQLLDLDAVEKIKIQKQLVILAGQLDLLTTKNKALNSSNIDLTEMLAKVNSSKVHDKVDKAEAAIDTAAEQTIALDNVDQVVEAANGISTTAASETTVKAVEAPTVSNINDINKTAVAQEALTKVDSPKAEQWIMDLVAAGKAQYTNEGFVINPENQKQFESVESHSEILNSEQSEKMIAALSEKGIAFSASSNDENGILLTVAQKDMLALNDIMYQTIGKTAHIHNERVPKAEGNFQTVNSDYYASLPKDQKYTTSMSADKASLIQDELLKAKIPYSMVMYQGGSASMTVSTANKKAFRDIAEKFDEVTALNDKDGDHIPDKIDGTYSPEGFKTQTDMTLRQEQYRMAVITEDEFNELKKAKFSFSRAKAKRDDDKIVIRYKPEERDQFESILAAAAINRAAIRM